MADQNFNAALVAALEQRYRREVVQQPNRATVLLNLMSKRPGKGKNIAYDISVGTEVGQVFDDGADVVTYNNDTELPVTHSWGEYGDAFAITGRAEDAADGDGTELSNLWAKKLIDARNRAAAKAQLDLMTGDGTGSPQKLLGLFAAAGPLDSTGIYGGQNRATFPQWAGNKFANAGVPRPITTKLLQDCLTATYIASGMTPDFMITTPTIWQKIGDMIQPDRRYNQSVNVRGQEISIDQGYEWVLFNGIPIFKDKDIPAGNFAGLSMSHIGIEYLPVAAQRLARSSVLGQYTIAGTPQEQKGAEGTPGTPLVATLHLLARTGNKTKCQLLTTIQTWSDKNNAHFWLADLSST